MKLTMEATTIICRKCGESVTSKRALKRHLVSRHPLGPAEEIDVAVESRRILVSSPTTTADVVVVEAVDESTLVKVLLPHEVVADVTNNKTDTAESVPNVPLMELIPGSIQPRKVTENDAAVSRKNECLSDITSKESTVKMGSGRHAALQRNRTIIDSAVGHLMKAHLRDKTTLSRPTDQLVDELRRKFAKARLPREVFVGVVVSAKHFAGTQKPKRNVPSGRLVQHRRGSPVEKVKRRLFVEAVEVPIPEISAESAMIVDLPVPVVENPESTVMELESCSMSAEDQEWCRDVWRSYGSREVQLPSPIGCSASPSAIFGVSPMPPSTPVELWSPSSDDFPWGPDSPEEELEEGSQPLIPDWPLLADDDGYALDCDGSAFDRRLVEWRSERTSRCVRVHPKRRHHTRSRRASRERHRTQLPMFVTDWSNGEGFIRPANPSDVKLPSPPESKSALLQLRRRLLMERKLPKGCRIMPARGSKRRRVESTGQVHDDLSKTETANGEAPALPAQPELVVPDVEINVFDDNF
jgi:hypothetical protein